MTHAGIAPLPEGHEIMEHIVRAVIGEGGFGIVYRAEHPKLHITAAVKEFAPARLAYRDPGGALVPVAGKEALYRQILERFDTTAAQLCALDHPNIVRVFNQRSDNNTSYVLMEYVTGETLGAWVQARIATLDHARLREVLLPLLDAIAYLHDRHLMHRDIAPDNILMRHDGVPILIDFGTLKQHVLGEETTLEESDEGDASAVVAKKFFSPPEQFSSYRKSELGATADIYSLGATIYDALAGRAGDMTRHLVPATDRVSSIVAPGGRAMPPLREVTRVDLPRSFCDAVDAALALSPRDRPQSVAAFRALLFPDLASAHPPGPPPGTKPSGGGAGGGPPPGAEEGLRWGRMAGLGTLGALVAGAGVFVLVQADDTNGEAAPPASQAEAPAEMPAPTAPVQRETTQAATAPALPEPFETTDATPPAGQAPLQVQPAAPETAPVTSPPAATPPVAASVPDFRLDIARTVSGLGVSGVVPPDLRAALEGVFGAAAIGPDLATVEGVALPGEPDIARLARIVQDWSSFELTAGPDGARLQGEPISAASYFDALEAAGGAVDLDLSFLTRTLPRDDVLALIDRHDPCGTVVPLDLGADLSPSDQLTLFGQVANVQQGIDLRRDLILLLPGTLDGDGLHATSQAMCDAARAFDDLALGSPDLSEAVQVTMDGTPAALGAPVSHEAMPQFALRRDLLPATGHVWTGLVMRGPGRSLVMLPLSQPSGDVEDLSLLSRAPGAPDVVALSLSSEAETRDLDLAFAPELALNFDEGDSYATLLGLVLDREISGLPALGETSAPDAAEYLAQLRAALERTGASVVGHFQRAIEIE